MTEGSVCYLYVSSGGQWSGLSSLVWFCRMSTIKCLITWTCLSAPDDAEKSHQVKIVGQKRLGHRLARWPEGTHLSHPALHPVLRQHNSKFIAWSVHLNVSESGLFWKMKLSSNKVIKVFPCLQAAAGTCDLQRYWRCCPASTWRWKCWWSC